MSNFFVFLGIVWFLAEIKSIFFWLFLWQLKDYHIGRFVDHFRTQKGKTAIINASVLVKVFFFLLFLGVPQQFQFLVLILIFVYIIQDLLFLRTFITRSVKAPKITLKAFLLFLISGGLAMFFGSFVFYVKELSLQPLLFLGFDILTPLIVSAIVLLVQPFFVLARNFVLFKAKLKIKKMKTVSGVKVVAITGSYGKTTTKEFLSTILSEKFKVLSTKEHQNSEIGVAKCILNDLKPSHQIFIAEVGAYNKGKVKQVCSMIKPQIGVVTGVNEQHLALFGSLKNLLSAEGGIELANSLPENGLLVVNGDNKHCLNLLKKDFFQKLNKKAYSLSNKVIDADIWADAVEVHKDRVIFIAMDKTKEIMHFEANILGKQSVQNLLGAILVAKHLGMNFGEISEACKKILQKQSGMVLTKEGHGINVVDSSYSSNPDGVFADLEYLSIFSGKKAIVMPCLIELGKSSSEIHEKIGKKIAEICDLCIITSKDNFADIKKGFEQINANVEQCLLCENPQDIYAMLTLFCKAGDTVLLEGRVPAKLIDLLK